MARRQTLKNAADKPVSKESEEDKAPEIVANGETRILNTHPDVPDLRDRMYEPALLELAVGLKAPEIDELRVLNQFKEGACTGFAMAAAVNLLLARSNKKYELPKREVSARMMYEMAKLHDEWPGNTYSGSSVRGAMKGFFHNGVCAEEKAVYKESEKDWHLNVEQAKDARETGLGAYFRLRPKIIDYHAALNEVGVVVASAYVHRGWQDPKMGVIKQSRDHFGGHAFIIVGYDKDGFLVQNSWGDDWGRLNGRPGLAHWSYADWAENIVDAWVMRVAVPTPGAFDLTHTGSRASSIVSNEAAFESPAPRRIDVLGHIVHIDDGKLVTEGQFATDMASIRETAAYLKSDSDKDAKAAKKEDRPKYDHLLIYAHGGLNSPEASARRVAAMKPVFKRNGIYPIHLMWETGFSEQLGDIFREAFMRSQNRVGFGRDALDWMIEKTSRRIGTRLWRQMKVDAVRAFDGKKSAGWQALAALLTANAASANPKKVHLVGHSAGSVLFGELLKRWSKIAPDSSKIDSMSLMAPACTVDYYNSHYLPALGKDGSRVVDSLEQYNLIDKRELDDKVGPYGKSLLYFVSRAFEEKPETGLLGMELYSKDLTPGPNHKIHYAGRAKTTTDSATHGGFDNDRATMNSVLTSVLGKRPKSGMGFQKEEVVGY